MCSAARKEREKKIALVVSEITIQTYNVFGEHGESLKPPAVTPWSII